MSNWDTQWFDLEPYGDTSTAVPDAAEPDAQPASISEDEIRRIMAQLAGQASAAEFATPIQDRPTNADGEGCSADDVPEDAPILCDELRQVFLEDVQRCVAVIEDSLIALEGDPSDRRPLRQVGRELHTLKGASASIGMSRLASLIHNTEDAIRTDENITAAALFQTLDEIRSRAGLDPQPAETTLTAAIPAPAIVSIDHSATDEDLIRVKSSQLNRMMDMLAELVMLRNRRTCELEHLQSLHSEILRSASTVRISSDESGADTASSSLDREISTRLMTVANDLLRTAHGLRSSYQPIVETNASISQFIRQFRNELVHLRRLPISGLFRRLRRTVSDAARAEGKKVDLELLGEDAGIERTLQDRLYDPLLHLVRNAVSHGIESPDDRRACRKPERGRIALSAAAGSDAIVITIQDDGRGLDYDAIRRRGLEAGLLKANSTARDHELAQLIFHPGFSTRRETSELAGRGVGMDVVASTINRMRGWIQIDSDPGRGTTIRLSIPLPSVIQHAMVFRSADQLYALPMQFVGRAGDANHDGTRVSFRRLSGAAAAAGHPAGNRPAHESGEGELIVLALQANASPARATASPPMAILVDEILGPDEVVVRPLPPLLRHHPLCCGATLAGTGQLVLFLDCHKIVELGTFADA